MYRRNTNKNMAVAIETLLAEFKKIFETEDVIFSQLCLDVTRE